jgi:uncharacterized membrane protein YbhN (UPF0104 family)
MWVYLCFAYISFVEKTVYSSFCTYPYKTAFLTTVYGNLGSCVSPLKSAHFPLKVYTQKTSSMTLTQTLTGVTKCQIIFSATSVIAYGTLTVYLFITGGLLTVENLAVPLYIIVGIGFVANFSVFIFLTLISRIEKMRTAVLFIFASLVKIFKRKLDKVEFIQKKTERLRLFKEQTSAVFSKFYLFLFPAIAYVLYMFVSCLAPYVSYLCVSGAGFSIRTCFSFYLRTLATLYLTNVIPLPGGCVVSEFVFSCVFASVTGDFLAQTLLLWRLSTYYIPTIINLTSFIIYSIKHAKQSV